MTVPSPWTAVILALAAYRIWRLLAEDVILDIPRRWVVRLPQDWVEGAAIPYTYRARLAEFINCCWCFGAWISIAVWIAWQINPHWVTIFMVPFAVSSAVGITRSKLDPPE